MGVTISGALTDDPESETPFPAEETAMAFDFASRRTLIAATAAAIGGRVASAGTASGIGLPLGVDGSLARRAGLLERVIIVSAAGSIGATVAGSRAGLKPQPWQAAGAVVR